MPVLPRLQGRHGSPSSDPDHLTTPPREVTDFSPPLRQLAADLLDTLRHHGAAGIAAPQVGVPLRVAVAEQEGGEPLVIVNPRIIAEEGPVSDGPEGCLSVPGVRSLVGRPAAIRVSFQDLAGIPMNLEAREWPARIIAHEIDHLEGVPGPAGRPGSEERRLRRSRSCPGG
jgi:peptide deformylase